MKERKVIGPDHLGLRFEVYRSALTGSCTMGASVRHNTIWIANDQYSIEGNTKPLFRGYGHVTRAEAERAGVPLFQVGIAGNRRHAHPIPMGEESVFPWFMFGGNFAYAQDSRASEFPIHLHDRTENAGACYPFYGVNDKPIDIGGFSDRRSFLIYLDRLVKDLKKSGSDLTAEDFNLCMQWMNLRL